MKLYGKLRYEEGWWYLAAEPHVLMRAKAVFGRVDKWKLGEVRLLHSAEICFELSWFLERYPLEVRNPKLLNAGRELYALTMEELRAISVPDYVPTARPLAKPLRDYQARMVDIYLQRGSLLCADTLGLGKSIEAIGSFTDPRTLPAIIVCKSHLAKQWAEYCAEFMPGLRVHLIKTQKNYDLPEADVYVITYMKLWHWVNTLSRFIRSAVYDECQELRREESQKNRAAIELRKRLKFSLGLSATPIYNYGGEIFNVLGAIAPGCVGTREEFLREWCDGHGKDATLKDPDAFGTYLREHFWMIRRTRAEVGRELPPVQTIVETIDYDVDALKAIDGIATELAKRVLEGSFEDSGQAARELDLKLRQATGIAKAPFVAAFVQMLVRGEGEKVLLCGWHRAVYDIWEHHLRVAGIKVCYYTGTESPSHKEQSKTQFITGECPVMFMSLRSGDGLDGLQNVCRNIVFGELDWSPGVHEQCRGRLFRDGQGGNVAEFFLVANGGSDPIIADILGLKKAQVTGLLDPGSGGLSKLQTDTGRVKRMAQDFLARHNKPIEAEN